MSRQRSVIDFFFHPSETDPAGDVLRACESLVNQDAPPRDRSHGEVKQPAGWSCGGYPLTDGLASETIFGDSAEERAERFGHINVPNGVLHPALAKEVGRALKISAADALAIARAEAMLVGRRVVHLPEDRGSDWPFHDDHDLEKVGIPIVRKALKKRAALLTFAVPVLPPGDRPRLVSEDPAVLAPARGPIERAYDALIQNGSRYARLRELNAPSVIAEHAGRETQLAFERLLETVRGEVIPEPLKPPTEEQEVRLGGAPQGSWNEPPAGVVSVVFVREDLLLVQDAEHVRFVRPDDGALVLEKPLEGWRALYASSDGEVVVFVREEGAGYCDAGLAEGMAALHLARGEWLEDVPQNLPLFVLENDQPEDLHLRDMRTGSFTKLETMGDRPICGALSRDGRFGSVRDEIVVELATARVFVESRALPLRRAAPFFSWDGTTTDEDALEGEDEYDDNERSREAIALTPARTWRILGSEGAVVENDRHLFTLGFKPEAAGFSPTADRLAIARDGHVLVIEVSAHPRVVARWALRH